MKHTPFELAVAGQSLQGYMYAPDRPKAVVILVHGMGEYGQRNERFIIPNLVENGLAVLTYDQFGHGRNKGKKGHHPGYGYLLECIDRCLDKSKEEWGSLPILLYGHSMGGNVVLNYLLTRPDQLAGAVVTSPFLRLAFNPPGWKLSLGKILAKLIPSMTLPNELDASAISQIPEEVEAYENDPMIHNLVSPAYSIEFMSEGEKILSRASEISTPMLLLHGNADRITDSAASRELAKEASDKVKFIEIEGGYHELHHDLEKEQVMKHILNWIDEIIKNDAGDDENSE